MKKINPYFAALLSGVLLAISFPPIPFFMMSFMAFVPILMVFVKDNPKHKYLLLYIVFFIFHAGSNWWIGSWQADTDPYLTASGIALALTHPFNFMIPFALFFIVQKRISTNVALWSFPFFWTAVEWVHNLGEFSYPWLTIGNTQIYNYYWVQFVDITGVWGASFLIALVNVLIVKSILLFSESGNFKKFIAHKIGIIYSAAILALIVIPIIYGVVRVQDFQHKDLMKSNAILPVGIIQPAINPWRKWEISVDDMIINQMNIADSLLSLDKKPALIIWNETAIPRYIDISNKFTYNNLLVWTDRRNVSLFTGFAEVQYYNSKNKTATARKDPNENDVYFESYNSSLLINPNSGELAQSYQKMRLTPIAERLPYSEKLMFMRSWFEWGVGMSGWGIGKQQKNLQVKNDGISASLGPVICIESIYPEFVANTAKNGAQFIVVITNDAWYDYTTGPEQHYLIAAMRAIENRRYVARCANTGVSGLIAPDGATIKRLPQYQKAGLYAEVPLIDEITFYSNYGDWLGYLVAAVSVVLLVISYLPKKLLKK